MCLGDLRMAFFLSFFLSLFLSIYINKFICIYLCIQAYGCSQDRGGIRAEAAGLHHSHSILGSKPHPQPTPQLMTTIRKVLNPLSKARDQTHVLMDTGWGRFH